MKKYKIISLILALLFLLTACNVDEAKKSADKAKEDIENAKKVVTETKENIDKLSAMVKELEELKVKYIGDNSKVLELINNTGIRDIGNFKIELQTSEEPYGLKINFDEEANKDVDYKNIEGEIVKLLGLIENLGYVEITRDGETTKYTEKEISEKLGFDVKDIYNNPEKLEDFIKDNYEKAK